MKKARVLSTICISALMTTAAESQDLPMGCFARDYSAEHLADQPQQVVERLRLNFFRFEDFPDVVFEVRAVLANQGHAARDGLGGMVMSEGGSCYQGMRCGVDCDGGVFEITSFDGNMLEIRTSHLRLATEGCGGEGVYSTLAETPDAPTTYRLYAAPAEACSEF